MGGGGRGHVWKTESAESHNPVAREEIAALPLPGSPGLEWGQLWTLGERLAHLPFPPPPDCAAKLGFAPGSRRPPAQRPSPERARGRAPPSSGKLCVHFRLSLLCKLQVMRGIGELRPLGPVLQAGRPGLSVVPAVFSQRLEKVPRNKSRDTPPSPSRARWRSRGSLCATAASLPRAARLFPRAWEGGCCLEPRDLPPPHHHRLVPILCEAAKSSPREREREPSVRRASGKGSAWWWGGWGSCASKEADCLIKVRPPQGSSGDS